MKIAIVGAGISGNVAAYLLSEHHHVTLFEAGSYPGGHTQTVDVNAYGTNVAVDIGFMVFNERTYPNFCGLLRQLGIPQQASDMSFSVRCERTGLEYEGSSLRGLFSQSRNLLSLRFLGMLRDIVRFNRRAMALLEDHQDEPTLGDFLDRHRFGRAFREQYLVPMTAAIWSTRPREMLGFPARLMIRFLHNHGLLSLQDRPLWQTIPGGARRYVEALLGPIHERLRLNTPIERILRQKDGVLLKPRDGVEEHFDAVVMATHADQSLRMLADADDEERRALTAFPYQKNEAVLHTDASALPTRRHAWASWNYYVPAAEENPVCVSYDLTRLQRLPVPGPIILTLNPSMSIDPKLVLGRYSFSHPVFTRTSLAAQARYSVLNGQRHTYYCGAYWRNGFHEDGVWSALQVAACFQKDSTRAELPV